MKTYAEGKRAPAVGGATAQLYGQDALCGYFSAQANLKHTLGVNIMLVPVFLYISALVSAFADIGHFEAYWRRSDGELGQYRQAVIISS